MNRHEKLDAAWRLTVGATLSKAVVSEAIGVSERTVAHMRDDGVGHNVLKLRSEQTDNASVGLHQRQLDADGVPFFVNHNAADCAA